MMPKVPFVCVADDDSGATDEGGMLVAGGMRTLIFIDLPEEETLFKYSPGFDAVIIANRTRALKPEIAKKKTKKALQLLQLLKPRMYQIKYCSTFDSTEEGNIGPSIDAALEVLGVNSTVVVPALPINKRTTYKGYHFVGDQLISDSPMKDHPLTPMTNPNLVSHLQKQTKSKVGLLPYEIVKRGAVSIREELTKLKRDGYGMIIVDAIEQRDLKEIAEATQDNLLITSSSGLAMEIPAIFLNRGYLKKRKRAAKITAGRREGKGILVVAGSCSTATWGQIREAQEKEFASVKVDVKRLLENKHAPSEMKKADTKKVLKLLNEKGKVIFYSSTPANSLETNMKIASKQGLSREEAGLRISNYLAQVSKTAVGKVKVEGLIVAGGETSGCICRELGIVALEVGEQIAPGVPLCYARGRYELPLVLKSGNFGDKDFFLKSCKFIKSCFK